MIQFSILGVKSIMWIRVKMVLEIIKAEEMCRQGSALKQSYAWPMSKGDERKYDQGITSLIYRRFKLEQFSQRIVVRQKISFGELQSFQNQTI